MTKRALVAENSWGSLPFTIDGSEQWIRNFRDYSKLQLKSSHVSRPVWVCPDGYLYLELFTPVSKQALDFIVTIAEPVCRPELIHEYQVTVFSLYTAVSVGLTFEELLSNLNKFSKNVLPKKLEKAILDTASAFGKIKLVLRDNKYWIESFERKELDFLLTNQDIRNSRIHSNVWEASSRGSSASGNRNNDYVTISVPTSSFNIGRPRHTAVFNTNAEVPESEEAAPAKLGLRNENAATKQVFSFEVQQEKIEELKREALQTMRRPLVMEYDFRKDNNSPSLNCCIRSNIKIR